MRFFTVPANSPSPVQLGGGVAASALPSLNCVTECNLNNNKPRKRTVRYKLSLNSKRKRKTKKKTNRKKVNQVLRRKLPDGRSLKIKVPTRNAIRRQAVKQKKSKPKGGFIF